MASFHSTYATILRAWKRRRPTQPQSVESKSRILCFTRAGISDLINTLPVLHALRRHFPQAHLTVACDPMGAPIARACPVVDDVIVLKSSWLPWLTSFKNAARLQGYDWAIAAVADFDPRLARLTRLTNASVRIGFARHANRPSTYYTDPVALPDDPEEHQIDTLLRLLKPLGLVKPTSFTVNLSLRVPDSARQFAAEILTGPPFDSSSPFMLMNLTSTVGLKFREEDFIELAGRILNSTNFVIGFFAALTDQQKAPEIAQCMGSPRIIALEAPGPLDLAALLEKALFLITPEGGAAHLAAAVDTPAIVLWSEGSFKKWHSRGRRNIFIDAQSEEKTIPVERVWQAIQPFLSVRQDDVEKKFADSLKLPPSSDFIS